MRETSRREFLKGALAGAASLTMAGVLSACGANPDPTPTPSTDPAPQKGTYTPGTYKATAQGYASEVTVTMTFTPRVSPTWRSTSRGRPPTWEARSVRR